MSFDAMITKNPTVDAAYNYSEDWDLLTSSSHKPLTAAEVNAAAEVVGLTWPISLMTKYSSDYYGFLRCREHGKHHRIIINQNLHRDYACNTAWHELIHARQVEHSGMDALDWYMSLNHGEKGSNPWIANTEYEAYQEGILHYLNHKDVLDPCLQ